MLIEKEKLEGMKWLEELLAMYRRNLKHPDLKEIAQEIKKVRERIATHDYAPREARRQASVRRFGKDSIYF